MINQGKIVPEGFEISRLQEEYIRGRSFHVLSIYKDNAHIAQLYFVILYSRQHAMCGDQEMLASPVLINTGKCEFSQFWPFPANGFQYGTLYCNLQALWDQTFPQEVHSRYSTCEYEFCLKNRGQMHLHLLNFEEVALKPPILCF